MMSPATGRKDLVLLLRPLTEEVMTRLEKWRNSQGEQEVMILSEYVAQYSAEFMGIIQLGKIGNFDKKIEQIIDTLPQKPKKDRRKRNRSSKQIKDNTENKSDVEMSAVNDSMEVPEEDGIEENEEVENPETEDSDEVEIPGA
jgi:hypothetical protein